MVLVLVLDNLNGHGFVFHFFVGTHSADIPITLMDETLRMKQTKCRTKKEKETGNS